MAPLVAALFKFGFPLLAQAVTSKGKEWVEEKTGVQLPDLATEPPPDVLLKLKQLEFDNQELLINAGLEEKRLQFETYKVDAQDRDSARRREAELAASPNAPHIGKVATPILAAFTVVGFFAVLGALIYIAANNVELAQGLREILYIMFGALTTQVGQVYNYYFGSSAGSMQKTVQLGAQK